MTEDRDTELAAHTGLIVNADDFGFFEGVSRGILDGIRAGAITATGVMANGPALGLLGSELAHEMEVDLGAHLNLTYGDPLTMDMKRALRARGGHFVSAGALGQAFLCGYLTLSVLRAELSAQMECIARLGRRIWFVNTHEHVELLPLVAQAVRSVIEEYGIPFRRQLRSEFRHAQTVRSYVRSAIVSALACMPARKSWRGVPIPCLGFSASGNLSLNDVERCLMNLRPASVYELMCHPGHRDSDALSDPKLNSYHNWEGELAMLQSPQFHRALAARNVVLTRFSDIQ